MALESSMVILKKAFILFDFVIPILELSWDHKTEREITNLTQDVPGKRGEET